MIKKSGNYLFLTDVSICPACRCRRGNHSGKCKNCGIQLFNSAEPDFNKYEADGNVPHWWAFHKFDGWKHRDHFMVEAAKPLHRKFVVPNLAKDYGKTTTPAEVAQRNPRTIRTLKKNGERIVTPAGAA